RRYLPIRRALFRSSDIERNQQIVRGRNLSDLRKQRGGAVIREPEAEVLIHSLWIRFSRDTWKVEQGRDFRGKCDSMGKTGVVERLDSERITCQHHLFRLRIQVSECEHPIEAGETPRSPLLQGR